MRLRHLAPAGSPIRARDLASWTRLVLSDPQVATNLQDEMCARFGVRYCALTSTGRAGLTLLLRALGRLAPRDRDEVVLPSYTCYSVAASVVKAGLRIRLVDIAPSTLDYNQARLAETDFTRVLAIVVTNLYGLPGNLPATAEIARRHGVFLIDDAAQAMGASVGGRLSGTWGDAGLFSFDKGKNVSAIDGGVVVTRSDAVAAALEEERRSLAAPSRRHGVVDVAKVLTYYAFLRPSLYGIPAHVPQLELGKTVYDTQFPLMRPSQPLVALARTMVDRLDTFTASRVSNARALLEGLDGVRGVQTIAPAADSSPVYLRLPVLLSDVAMRPGVLAALKAAGIGASGSYPRSIGDLPELTDVLSTTGEIEGGRYVAERVMTLPTHPFVGASDVREAIATIARALDGHAAVVARGPA